MCFDRSQYLKSDQWDVLKSSLTNLADRFYDK